MEIALGGKNMRLMQTRSLYRTLEMLSYHGSSSNNGNYDGR